MFGFRFELRKFLNLGELVYNSIMRRHWLAVQVLVVSVLFTSMYGLVYVLNRSLANDMPELLATQTAKQLDAGLGLDSVTMAPTDIANHPVPFVIIYDKKEKAVAGSGYLDKKLAQLPRGVVQHATPGKPHAVTWGPRKNIRIASVTVAAKNYYVVGGQSLQTTQNRLQRLLWLTLAGYGLAVCVVVGVKFCQCRHCRKTKDGACLHSANCTCNRCCAPVGTSKPSVVTAPAAPKSTKKRTKTTTKRSTTQKVP